MTELRGVLGGGSNRATLEEEQRLAAEAAGRKTAAAADAGRKTAGGSREYGVYLLPVVDSAVRAFAANAASGARVPPALADLTLYTDDALHREIDGAHARLATRPGPEGDGDRLALDMLEREVARRQAPAHVDVASLKTFDDARKALRAEVSFLGTHGPKLPTAMRVEHERAAFDLEARYRELRSVATACDNAAPLRTESLGGAHRLQLTADDVVATLKQQVPLSAQEEAQVRSTFEQWRADTCRTTGKDPTTVVASSHSEAKVDTAARDREMLQMRLDMLNAAATSACGALAFLDSAVRREPVEEAHRRVMLATALSDLVVAMPSRGSLSPDYDSRAPETGGRGSGRQVTEDGEDRGAARNTRFRDVDNSAKPPADVDLVTYGPWRRNAGPPRTVAEARAIYERVTGRKLPSWVKIEMASLGPGKEAQYALKNNADAKQRFDHDSLVDKGVVVQVNSGVFESDEAIVAVLSHEAHELENLERLTRNGRLTNANVNAHIKTDGDRNLHGQAWDVADLEVQLMRAKPGTPEHASLTARRESLMNRLELQNHGHAD